MITDLTGQQFGKYRLVRLLGSGGFASVYLGQHILLSSQQTAIKILHLQGVDLQRFQAEAETTAKLLHPHIVRLFDFDFEQGTPYLVLDYAPQGSLAGRHPHGQKVPLATVVSYLKQIAEALQFAHDQHVVHRDLKPDNILIGRQGELLLSDFGIAVLSQTGRTSIGSTYGNAGTAYYMAPEMFRGKPEKASDQYSLAVIAYKWLCGVWPFFEGDFIQLGFQHSFEAVPPLRQHEPMLPVSVEEAILKALSKQPQERFSSVQAFVKELEEASEPPKRAEPVRPEAPLEPTVRRGPILPLEEVSQRSKDAKLVRSEPQQPHSMSMVERGQVLLMYKGHTNIVRAVAWSPDGSRVVSGSYDKTVQVWDASSGRVVLKYTGHANTVDAVAWSPDGSRVVSGSYDKTARVWDVSSGRVVLKYTGHTDWVSALAWSPDGSRVVSGSYDKTVQVWDASSGRVVLKYTGHASSVYAVAWSPDGSRVASGSTDKTVRVWDASSGRVLLTYTGHASPVIAVVWSPDGSRVASRSYDGKVQVWDASSRRVLHTYMGHKDGVSALTWSPNSSCVASGSDAKTVQIWEVSSGRLLYTYMGHTGWVSALAWSPDGSRIVSGSDDGTVQVWQAI